MGYKHHYFYNVIRKTIIQFVDLFNDLTIARYNDDNVITKYVKVPVKFAPKTKQWYWSELRENKDRRDSILPMISIDLDNIDFAVDRQVNRTYKIKALNNGKSINQYYNPIPYDFTFKVQVASEYMVDLMQINEQILPFFSPESWIRITIPELDITGMNADGVDKLELRVIYDSSQNESPVELEEAGYRILLWTYTFKVQGYLFSPKYDSGSIIHKVVQSYYTNDETWSKRNSDVDNNYPDIGYATLNGVDTADIIPTGTPMNSDLRNEWTYTHYPLPPEEPIKLYTIPASGYYNYPYTVSIYSSSDKVKEIWYTLDREINTYILNNSDSSYIIKDGVPTFIVIDQQITEFPLTKYTEPILFGVGSGDYDITYVGILEDNTTTDTYSSSFNEILGSDDTISLMWRYEWLPRTCNTTLFTVPGIIPTQTLPITFEIQSNINIRDIWYCIIPIDFGEDYYISDSDVYMMIGDEYVIISDDKKSYPMKKYWRPLTVNQTDKVYIIRYIGVDDNDTTTPIFTSEFHVVGSPSFLPVSGNFEVSDNGTLDVSLIYNQFCTAYYTIDGSDPIIGVSPMYNGTSVVVSMDSNLRTTTTIKAITVDLDGHYSSISSSDYTLIPPLHIQALPPGGEY